MSNSVSYLAGNEALFLFIHISAQASLIVAAECEHFAVFSQDNSMHTTWEWDHYNRLYSLIKFQNSHKPT